MDKPSDSNAAEDVTSQLARLAASCPAAAKAIPGLLEDLEAKLSSRAGGLRATWTAHDDEQSVDGDLNAWRWRGAAMQSLLDAHRQQGRLTHWEPVGQPHQLHEFSSRILEAYQVDGGGVHLGGCMLEWKLAWQLFLMDESGDSPQPLTRWLHADGSVIEEDEFQQTGLTNLVRLESPPVPEVLSFPENVTFDPHQTLVRATCVWRCWVQGKVVATIGDASASVELQAWAVQITRDDWRPPKFVLPDTEFASYHMAADDDGAVAPVESLGVCAETGRKLARSKLVQSHESGDWLEAQVAFVCPASNSVVRPSEVAECGMCEQQVAKLALQRGRCPICRDLQRVRKDDPRLARLLGEFPKLDRWSKWKIGESNTTYVLVALTFARAFLVVIRKEPLEMVRVATASRWLGNWNDAPDDLQHELRTR